MADNSFISDDLAILAEFVDESEGELQKIGNLFVELEQRPQDVELVNTLFRPIHSIKGNSAFLGLMGLRKLAHEMESVLDGIRKQRFAGTRDMVSDLLAGVDEIHAILGRIRNGEKEITDPELLNRLIKMFVAHQGTPESGAESVKTADAPPAEQPPEISSRQAQVAQPEPGAKRPVLARTIRIHESLLDTLYGLSSEISTAAKSFGELVQQQAAAAQFAKEISGFGAAAARLEKLVATLRKVPMSELLARAPRIVRDAATQTGKTVQVKISGEDVLVSRRVVEGLEPPLMHMLRNAVDHGIEPAPDRRRAGKAPEGHVWVEAREENDTLILRIADDGAGIDFKTLLMKAMALGLCPKNRALRPEDVTALIFQPGISGAKKVTDLSGRGVGMDVVKSQVDGLGGTIVVNSKTGKGTEIIVQLPTG